MPPAADAPSCLRAADDMKVFRTCAFSSTMKRVPRRKRANSSVHTDEIDHRDIGALLRHKPARAAQYERMEDHHMLRYHVVMTPNHQSPAVPCHADHPPFEEFFLLPPAGSHDTRRCVFSPSDGDVLFEGSGCIQAASFANAFMRAAPLFFGCRY